MTTRMRRAACRATAIAAAAAGVLSSTAAAEVSVPAAPSAPTAPLSAESLLAPVSTCPGQFKGGGSRRVRAAAMFCLHQYARDQLGMTSLRLPGLNRSAKGKAKDVMRCDQLSHFACGRGGFFWERRHGLLRRCAGLSENLAYGTGGWGSPRQMMLRWLKSSAHRSALTSGGNAYMGFAVVTGRFQGRSRTNVWVAHFGSSC